MYVNAGGGLRMRVAPSTEAERVLTIPDKASVAVIETEGPEIELAGTRGKWTKVDYAGNQGWVFGGFLVAALREETIQTEAYEIPAHLHGKYLPGSSASECIRDYSAELYVTPQSIWCISGESGEIFSYCVASSGATAGSTLTVQCRDNLDYTDFSAHGFPADVVIMPGPVPYTESITLESSGIVLKAPCGGPPGQPVDFLSTQSSRVYCNQL